MAATASIDVDWATVSWHAADHARMRRMLDAWDQHLVHPSLPRTLMPRLHDAGFADVRADGHAFVTTALDAEAWKAEQEQLAARGEFYFACTQVCFAARRR